MDIINDTDTITVNGKAKKLQPRLPSVQQRDQQKPARNAIKRTLQTVTDDWMANAICSLALPDGSNPVRYSSRYASAPTACAAPFKRVAYPAVLDTAINQVLPTPSLFGAVFRDPFRAAILYDPNAADAASTYSAKFATLGGVGFDADHILIPGNAGFGTFQIPIECLVTSSTYQPHGPALFTGWLKDQPSQRFIWADTGSSIVCTLNNSLGSGSTMRFILNKYSNGIYVPNFATADIVGPAGTACTFPITSSGYYAIGQSWTALPTGGYTVKVDLVVGTNGTMCHLALPDLFKNLPSVQGVRMNGLSIMYTNTSSDLNNSGRVAGLQAPQGSDWMNYAFGGFDSVAGAINSTTMDVKRGIYGFLKPSQPEDYNFKGDFDYDLAHGVPIGSTFLLECDSDYLVVYPQIAIQGGRDGYWSTCYTIEYLTTDVFREIEHADTPVASYEAAIMALATIQQWHENKTHFKDIVKKIRDFATRAAQTVSRYMPLISGAVALGKLGSMII